MAQDEIERRFLVKKDLLPDLTALDYVNITQGYLPEGFAKLHIEQGQHYLALPLPSPTEVLIPVSEDDFKELEVVPNPNARVRIADYPTHRETLITTKIKKSDGEYREFEFKIDNSYASYLLAACPLYLNKVRRFIPLEGTNLKFELDMFCGAKLTGTMVAEIELPSFDYEFERPEWLGKEITKIKGMSNFDMAKDPDLVCGMIRCIEKVQPLMGPVE